MMETEYGDLELVKRVLNTENDLNTIMFKSIPVGGLFSKLLFAIYRNDRTASRQTKLSFIFSICFISVKNFFRKPKIKARDSKKVLFVRITNRPNRKKLIDPLAVIFEDVSVLFSSTSTNRENCYRLEALPHLGITATIRIFFNALVLFPKIKKIFKGNSIECSNVYLFNVLLTQLLKLESAIHVYRKLPLKLVLCDYDRNDNANYFILAAKKYNIKTVTLVHGAIYPPYGYAPILADEIWCWGALQKEQLEQMNVASDKIKITGNPMAEVMQEADLDINAIIEEYDIKGKLVIGLTLNNIGLLNNIKIIDFILNVFKIIGGDRFILLVKPHPAMKSDDLGELGLNANLRIHNRKYSNEIFFCLADILFTRGSSMAYEAVINNVPTGLIDVDTMDANKGNMYVMASVGKIPIFANENQLATFLENMLENRSEMKKELISNQKQFVNNYYYKIGNEAVSEIASEVNNIIHV